MRRASSEILSGALSAAPKTNSAPSERARLPTNAASESAAARSLWLKCRTNRFFSLPRSADAAHMRAHTESAPPEHAAPILPPRAAASSTARAVF